ncbi:MAG TPA: hypothetical protein VGH20_06685 [Myxococcales bacterium]|jgi:hypothetical protein
MTSWQRLPLFAFLLLASCFNSSGGYPIVVAVSGAGQVGFLTPVPTGETQIVVSGFNLQEGAIVFWQGRPHPGVLAGPTPQGGAASLQVTLDLQETLTPGAVTVSVQNPDSLSSKPVHVDVEPNNFSLTAISPDRFALGAGASTATLSGTDFFNGMQITWSGTVLTPTVQDGHTATVQVPASLLAAAGDALVQVVDRDCPACGPSTTGGVIAHVGAGVVVGPFQQGVLAPSFQDVAGDRVHGLLLGTSGNSLAAIDPTTGALGAGVAASGPIAVSDGAEFVYAQGVRFTLPGLTEPTTLPPQAVGAVAAAPGAPQTVAYANVDAINVFDGTTRRPLQATGGFFDNSITWGADTSVLYAVAGRAINKYPVTASGVGAATTIVNDPSILTPEVIFDGVTRRLYTGSGQTYDEEGGTPLTFDLTNFFTPAQFTCHVAVDSGLGKAFFACDFVSSRTPPGLWVAAYDLATQAPLGGILLAPGPTQSVSRIVRFGNDGLAVIGTTHLYLYRGQFVRP